jgi:hypothetical protein
MKLTQSNLPAGAIILAATALAGAVEAIAQARAEIPPSITTPDQVETRIGVFEFDDGTPSKATLEKVYDHLDFTHAFRAFLDTMQGVNIHAIRKGFHDFGAKDNEVVVCSELCGAEMVPCPKHSLRSRGTFAVRCLQLVADVAGGRERQAFLGHGWPGNVLAQPLQLLAFIRHGRHSGMQTEAGQFACRVRELIFQVAGRQGLQREHPAPRLRAYGDAGRDRVA